jgi:hypothetical protein
LRSSGFARRFIDGSNIADFLSPILSSWVYRNRFGHILVLVFLKFCNVTQQRQVFSIIANDNEAIENFMDLITAFLDNVSKCANDYKMLPLDFV